MRRNEGEEETLFDHAQMSFAITAASQIWAFECFRVGIGKYGIHLISKFRVLDEGLQMANANLGDLCLGVLAILQRVLYGLQRAAILEF